MNGSRLCVILLLFALSGLGSSSHIQLKFSSESDNFNHTDVNYLVKQEHMEATFELESGPNYIIEEEGNKNKEIMMEEEETMKRVEKQTTSMEEEETKKRVEQQTTRMEEEKTKKKVEQLTTMIEEEGNKNKEIMMEEEETMKRVEKQNTRMEEEETNKREEQQTTRMEEEETKKKVEQQTTRMEEEETKKVEQQTPRIEEDETTPKERIRDQIIYGPWGSVRPGKYMGGLDPGEMTKTGWTLFAVGWIIVGMPLFCCCCCYGWCNCWRQRYILYHNVIRSPSHVVSNYYIQWNATTDHITYISTN